jgi:hypothetical protein
MFKPDLNIYFSAMPLIGMYLKAEYEKVRNIDQMTALMHKWFNDAENTNNDVKRIHIQASAQFLYTYLTGKSYESKTA